MQKKPQNDTLKTGITFGGEKMREVFNAKKKHILKLTAAMLLGVVMMANLSTQIYAAPKQMPDGNVFDAQFYAATYPDVVAVLGTDESVLYNHYLLCGKGEGRLPFAPDAAAQPTTATPIQAQSTGAKVMPDGNLFDAVFYAKTYPDVAAVLGTDEAVLYNHYLLLGSKEGRLPYELSAQELRNQEIYNKIMALKEMYPQGMRWDMNSTYIQPEGENRENGWAGLTRRGCQAFAYTVQDAVFGPSAKINWYQTGLSDWCMTYAGGRIVSQKGIWIPVGYTGQDPQINAKFEEYWNKIQVGDAIADCNHIVIVLTKADDHVTVVEGNYNNMVNWGRKITKEQLRVSLETVETPSW